MVSAIEMRDIEFGGWSVEKDMNNLTLTLVQKLNLPGHPLDNEKTQDESDLTM